MAFSLLSTYELLMHLVPATKSYTVKEQKGLKCYIGLMRKIRESNTFDSRPVIRNLPPFVNWQHLDQTKFYGISPDQLTIKDLQ